MWQYRNKIRFVIFLKGGRKCSQNNVWYRDLLIAFNNRFILDLDLLKNYRLWRIMPPLSTRTSFTDDNDI